MKNKNKTKKNWVTSAEKDLVASVSVERRQWYPFTVMARCPDLQEGCAGVSDGWMLSRHADV